MTRAAQAPESALAVGLLLWFQAGWAGGAATFPIDVAAASELGLAGRSLRRGLDHLEGAGLIALDRRRGRTPNATIRAVVAIHPGRPSDASMELERVSEFHQLEFAFRRGDEA